LGASGELVALDCEGDKGSVRLWKTEDRDFSEELVALDSGGDRDLVWLLEKN
jgi:hypothetical protein